VVVVVLPLGLHIIAPAVFLIAQFYHLPHQLLVQEFVGSLCFD
jgi:hypothetical protein